MSTIIEKVAAATTRGALVRPKVGGFPYLAEAMRQAGITKNSFDVPSMSMVYVTAEGNLLQPGPPMFTEATIVPPFNEAALVTALRADQRGETEFSDFVTAIFNAGVVRFEVDTVARVCTYFGAGGTHYREEYAAVALPSEHV